MREKSCRYRSANSLAHELESHARSLVRISLAKMSVYVMSAPLDNWHIHTEIELCRTRSFGVCSRVCCALKIFFSFSARLVPSWLTGMSRMNDQNITQIEIHERTVESAVT